jgi:hypothetical protein
MNEGIYRDALVGQPSADEQLARTVVNDSIEPGERILWAGRPARGLLLSWSDVLLIPFSLMWGGFAIFWELTAIRIGGPLVSCLWGIPFVAMGLYAIAGRFFADAYRRAHTFYAITSTRAFIVVTGLLRKSTALDLAMQGQIELTETRSGQGSIYFGHRSISSFLGATSWPGANKGAPPSFERIHEVRAVYNRIVEGQQMLRDKTS